MTTISAPIRRPISHPFEARRSEIDTTPAAPVSTSAPVVSGVAEVGQTLSCFRGTWSGYPASTFTYQWRRGAVNIGGATAETYLTVEADLGIDIDCWVTATNSEGSAAANSNALTIAEATPDAGTFDSTSVSFDSDTLTFDEVA